MKSLIPLNYQQIQPKMTSEILYVLVFLGPTPRLLKSIKNQLEYAEVLQLDFKFEVDPTV